VILCMGSDEFRCSLFVESNRTRAECSYLLPKLHIGLQDTNFRGRSLVEDALSTVVDRVKMFCVCLTLAICAVRQDALGYTGYIKWNLVVRLILGLEPFGDNVPEKPAIIFGRADE
jgi:hypothetical protein